ncbi:oligogalacturonate lyase family protein [Natronorarus salvus]|uniref:oligogalacturonate lyase family protein n=1 Tax=Natronorarus salvus TaxID=3117733 RepID=UPI002F263A27
MAGVEVNGNAAGRQLESEVEKKEDSETGAPVTQLTNYFAHSHQLYYTNTSWYEDEGKVLFGSDRHNSKNLYSADIESGLITQLTDLEVSDFERSLSPPRSKYYGGGASINQEREEAYFWYDKYLWSLDLNSYSISKIYELPQGYRPLRTSVTADGNNLCTGITEILRDEIITSSKRQKATPESKILRISLDRSGVNAQTLYEDDMWLGHPNASPTKSNLMTFSPEGPWSKQDERIFGLDMETGESWAIRPKDQGTPYGGLSHEHWLADGTHIGYHGYYEDGTPFFGTIRHDNTEQEEVEISADLLQLGDGGYKSHFHRNEDILLTDGSPQYPYLIIWPIDNGLSSLGTPRKLVCHNGSWQHPRLHVHPRISPDGSRVLYSSNESEYQNIYSVEIPDLKTLPEVTH